MNTLTLFLSVIFGAIFGSFSTFFGYRLFNENKDINLFGARSICCNCNHELSWKDLIPILSFIFLKGQCRYCKNNIPVWHFLAEIFMILSFVTAVKYFGGINEKTIFMWIICFCLITQSIIDLRIMLSSDVLHIIEFFSVIFLSYRIGISFSYIFLSYISMILFFFILIIFMKKIYKKDCIGFGDIKLFVILSPLLFYEKIPLFFCLCGIFGIISYFIATLSRQKRKLTFFNQKLLKVKNDNPFPFIPAIFFAFLLAFYF